MGGFVGAVMDEENQSSWGSGVTVAYGSAVGAGVGFVLGTVFGMIISSSDEVTEPFSEEDLSGLRVYSKYQYEEPENLRKVK